MVTIGDLLLDKQFRTRIGKNSIVFVEGGMLSINVGRMIRIIYGCNSCRRNHLSNECRQPNKVINMPNHVVDPQQQARDNMRNAKPHGAPTYDLRPPNFITITLMLDKRSIHQWVCRRPTYLLPPNDLALSDS